MIWALLPLRSPTDHVGLCCFSSSQNGLEPVARIPADPTPRFELGSRVITLYGGGVVKRYRVEDGVYEVWLDWTASAVPQKPVTTTNHQNQATTSSAAKKLAAATVAMPSLPTSRPATPQRNGVQQHR